MDCNILSHKRPDTVGEVGSGGDISHSQFFICFAPAPHLNGQYTVWGKVIEGMENVDKVAVGEPPANPTRMTRVRLQSELQ